MINRKEQQIQIECVSWLRLHHPGILHTQVNNNSSSPAAGRRNKAMGCVKGFPDFLILHQSGGHCGIAVEFKAPGEKPRPEQQEILDRLQEQGFCVCVVSSFLGFKAIIENYLEVQTEPLK